ncbi:hypothetical protein ACET3Z_032289 [Daucus carota]
MHLHSERTEWTLRVQAQSIWKSINRQTQEFRGLNVIFIDEENSRIHAFVSSKITVFFADNLKEGGIYTLSNFHVRDYGVDEQSRAVRFGKHIYFSNQTELVQEVENSTDIAPYAFDLFGLHESHGLLIDNRFLIDVVSVLEDKNIQLVQSKDDEKKFHIRFKITDGRSSMNVTFFGDLAVEFEKSVKETKESNIAIIIASAKRKVRCQITVKRVDEKSNWYDNVCTTCGYEVTIVEGRYRCVVCSRNVPFPDKRFRLGTLCNDATGLIAIVFPDDEIQRITGKNAFDIEEELADEKIFPPILKEFEKKEYVITLIIGERNVSKISNIYNATDIADPVEVLGNHSPTEAEDVKLTDDIPPMETPCTKTAPKGSPTTAASTNKVRSRDKKTDISYELEDNVPIGKCKIPKTDKA